VWREKWDEMRGSVTYLRYTIDRALNKQTEKLLVEADKEYEAFKPKMAPPINEKMFYGLPGRIIKKLSPETESHPVGNLVELLVVVGSINGHHAYVQVEDTRHYTNLFGVKGGSTADSRKGTGKARIENIARLLCAVLGDNWFDDCQASGIGSGEYMVQAIQDDKMATVEDKKSPGLFVKRIVKPGVADKRLLVSEGEFAKILTVANKKTRQKNSWVSSGSGSLPSE